MAIDPRYNALITLWPTLPAGDTTAQKMAVVNSMTVTLPAQPAILTPSKILNAIVPADLASLTTAQVSLLALLLSGSTVDASQGTTIRAAAQTIFAGKTTTLSQLGALVAPFDAPTMLWWQATVAQGGGGLNGPVTGPDLVAAGISVLTTSAVTASGSAVLTFASVPTWVIAGMEVHDISADGPDIPVGTTVLSTSATTVTMSHPCTGGGIAIGDTIGFN